MDARYTLELRDRDPAEIEDLILDNCKATEITGLTDKLVNLQSLSMINVGLVSLKGLPKLPNLTKLDISDNSISGGLDIISTNCPELLHLNLSNNKIANIEVLAGLQGSKLAELDLFSNDAVNNIDDYRDKVFSQIPTLQILDGCDANGEEIDDDSIDGEDLEEAGESGEEDSDDEDDIGLSYLDNSQLDEDETEDYDPEVEKKGVKRRAAEDSNGDEPEAKAEKQE